MTDAQTLLDLALRCEKATGPDRELDLAIQQGVSGNPWRWSDSRAFEPQTVITWDQHGVGAPGNPFVSLEEFTGSIDAAMTLRSAGFGWNMQGNETVNYAVVKGHDGKGTTPALALCAAALRARAATDSGRE